MHFHLLGGSSQNCRFFRSSESFWSCRRWTVFCYCPKSRHLSKGRLIPPCIYINLHLSHTNSRLNSAYLELFSVLSCMYISRIKKYQMVAILNVNRSIVSNCFKWNVKETRMTTFISSEVLWKCNKDIWKMKV